MKQCMDADNLHRRLKKIIGQVQAIDRMVDEDVPCEDILAQINAAKSALHGCGKVVLEGIGESAKGDEFDVMEQLHDVTGVPVPKNLADLRSRAVRHRDVIDRGEMLDYVLGKAAAEK